MKKTWLSANKRRIIGTVIVPIIITIGTWIFSKNGNNTEQKNIGSGSEVTQQTNYIGDINASQDAKVQVANIITNQPTKLDEELQQDIEFNRGKINTFFRHWNARLYKDARNNIGPRISRIFPQDKMDNFKNSMTDLFRIKSSNLTDDKYSVSEFYVATKHQIVINYGYDGKYYYDDVFVMIERSMEDKKQHHITDIRCINSTKSPLCDFLR